MKMRPIRYPTEGGFYLHRKLLNSPVWQMPHTTRSLFVDLLMCAAWRPTRVPDGREIYLLQPGELFMRTHEFGERFGYTRSEIRVSLQLLELNATIDVRTTNRGTFVRMRNWSKYQNVPDRPQPTNAQRMTNGFPSDDQPHTVGTGISLNKFEEKESLFTSFRESATGPDVQVPELGFPQGHVDSVVDNPPNRGCTQFKGGDPPVAAADAGNPILSQAIAVQSDAEALFRDHKPKLARKRKSEGAHPEHERFVESFHTLFMSNRGAAPEWGAKQGSWVKQLLTKHGFDECMARAKRMFEMAPKWPAENPTLATLRGHWDSFAPPVAGIRPIGQGGVVSFDEHPEPGNDLDF